MAAQTTPVCSDTPMIGQRVVCEITDPDDSNDITINLTDPDIDTTQEPNFNGVHARHIGRGSIDIDIAGGTIDTTGIVSQGIFGEHWSTQDIEVGIDILVKNVAITAQGESSYGVRARLDGKHGEESKGDVRVRVEGGSIATSRRFANAIQAASIRDGTVAVEIQDVAITTQGDRAHGIHNVHQGDGDETIRATGSSISTQGDQTNAIYALRPSAGTAHGATQGNTTVDLTDVQIETQGTTGVGVRVLHGTGFGGDIDVDMSGGSITTYKVSEDNSFVSSYGIVVQKGGSGNIDIDVDNGASIVTKGQWAYGVWGYNWLADDGTATPAGNIDIDVSGGASVRTEGDNAVGLYGRHLSGKGRIAIRLDDASVATAGANASAIQVGRVRSGEVDQVAGFDDDGYRRQTVTVNGTVTGTGDHAAGVYLAGGGRAVVGPRGSIDMDSGIAIVATGDAPGANPEDPAIKPKLQIDMNLGERRVAEAIGDNWIINDGGETTLAVNGVVLHDGAMGVTGNRAAYGAWDIWMEAEGVTVTDRADPDPANWAISTRAAGVIADRDFSAEDFMEGYAPRTAVYEVLAGMLLRLDARRLSEQNLAWQGSPLWVRLSGGHGSFEPDHATVGAEYDLDRFSAEAGLGFALGESLAGSFSVRGIRGDAEVDSPTGGGKIEADGVGGAFGIYWGETEAHYAHGRYSFTRYQIDLSSEIRGRLKKDLDARSHILDLEAGRRMGTYGPWGLTPRIWMVYSRVDVDGFTDVVDTRISVDDETRFAGGFGVIAESRFDWNDGKLLLRGSADVERMLGGSVTKLDVSGERLSSDATRTRVLLNIGGTYRRESFSIEAGISAEGPASDAEFYSGHIGIRWEH